MPLNAEAVERLSIAPRGDSWSRTILARRGDAAAFVVTRARVEARLQILVAGHAAETLLVRKRGPIDVRGQAEGPGQGSDAGREGPGRVRVFRVDGLGREGIGAEFELPALILVIFAGEKFEASPPRPGLRPALAHRPGLAGHLKVPRRGRQP